MRRLVIIIVVLVLVGVGVCVGASLLAPKLINRSDGAPAAVETPPAAGTSVIRAQGKLGPIRVKTLSFASSGTVGQLAVEVGDEVSAGQVVAQLDTTDLEWTVRQAEDALAAAHLTYSQTIKAASPEDIASAEAALTSAKATLPSAEAGRVSAQAGLASAQAGLISARIALTNAVTTRDTQEDTRAAAEAGVRSARASLTSAQASLAALHSGPDADRVEQARLSWEQARNNLARMQMERDAVQARRGVPRYVLEQMKLDIANLEIAVRMAEISYLDAQNAGATEEAIAAAEASVAAAEAGVINARAQVDDIDNQVAQAEASVAQAEATVTQAEAGVLQAEAGTSQAETSVLQAEASVSQAQAALDRLRAGPDELAVAQAALNVRQAEAALEQANARLPDVEIHAPFNGTISAVEVEEGDLIASGAPVVTLADLSGWQVETKDLDEWGVTHIATGEAVRLVFTAFDDKTLAGHIQEIDLNPTELPTGDVTYRVTIALDESDPALRWGMSVRVEFEKSE